MWPAIDVLLVLLMLLGLQDCCSAWSRLRHVWLCRYVQKDLIKPTNRLLTHSRGATGREEL